MLSIKSRPLPISLLSMNILEWFSFSHCPPVFFLCLLVLSCFSFFLLWSRNKFNKTREIYAVLFILQNKYGIKLIFGGEEFCKFFLTKMLPNLLGQGPKPRSFWPELVRPAEQDGVRWGRAEPLVFAQGMTRVSSAVRAPAPQQGGAFCTYRPWRGVIPFCQACCWLFCCTQPFCTGCPKAILVLTLGTLIFAVVKFLQTSLSGDIV